MAKPYNNQPPSWQNQYKEDLLSCWNKYKMKPLSLLNLIKGKKGPCLAENIVLNR